MRLPSWLSRSADPQISLGEWASFFNFGGLQYPLMLNQTLVGDQERVDPTFQGYVQAGYKANGIIFACMLSRLLVFSEATFRFRRVVNGRPGSLFGTSALKPLETPWPNATTGDLLGRAIQDADLAGNFFGLAHRGGIKRLRPDWMTIVVGSQSDAKKGGAWAIDGELLGYAYQPGGPGSGADVELILPEQVMHFAPIPDPLFQYRGMSWLTPVLRELMADSAATSHKLKFFENGATVNQVVSLDASITPENFERWIKLFEKRHRGIANAYKTMFIGGGADVKAIGSDLKAIDFKQVQGHGETRIAAAAGVPPVIVGLSEGLEAATYANYSQARRRFADGTMRPLWRNFAGSASTIIAVPGASQLWYDDRDVPFLQEDRKDAAEIQGREAATIAALIREGYTPDSVVAAVENDNWGLLKHTGLVSVQLHPADGSGPVIPPASLVPATTNGSGS